MAAIANDQFYAGLPAHKMHLGELLIKDDLFNEVPGDWYIVMTDIKGSTNAVFGGRHEDVNLIATGSIVSVLNIAYGLNVTVPFIFWGRWRHVYYPAKHYR